MFGKREFVFRDYFIKKIKVLLLSAGTEWHQDLAGVTLAVAKTRHEFQTESKEQIDHMEKASRSF